MWWTRPFTLSVRLSTWLFFSHHQHPLRLLSLGPGSHLRSSCQLALVFSVAHIFNWWLLSSVNLPCNWWLLYWEPSPHFIPEFFASYSVVQPTVIVKTGSLLGQGALEFKSWLHASVYHLAYYQVRLVVGHDEDSLRECMKRFSLGLGTGQRPRNLHSLPAHQGGTPMLSDHLEKPCVASSSVPFQWLNSTDKAQKCHAEWKKPGIKVAHCFHSGKVLEKAKLITQPGTRGGVDGDWLLRNVRSLLREVDSGHDFSCFPWQYVC